MLVFKTFSLSSILWSLCPRGRKILSTYEKIFYVEITTFARFLLTRTGLLSNKNIEELKFSLINIRDDLGELERLKLTRKHLFEFENLILCSSSYKLLIEETFIDLEMDNHILGYLQKSITHSEIMRDGLWRNIYLILVSQSIAKEINQNNVGIIMSNEPWKLAYDKFSLRHNIKVFFHKEFSFSLPNIYSLIRRSPIIHFFLKGIKYKEGFFDKNEHSEVNLFLEGRGDIVFEKDGSHSDFLWMIESNFPPQNVVYQYETLDEKDVLSKNGIKAKKITPSFRDLLSLPKRYFLKFSWKYYLEYREIKGLLNFYYSNFMTIKSFFRKENIKIYLTWNKFDADHILKRAAINSLGGVSAVWQIATDGAPLIDSRTHSDVIFTNSNFSADLEKSIDSRYKCIVITGCVKDYKNPQLRNEAQRIRNKLIAHGAKDIVCVYDENSHSDKRWHTGHELQKENYKFIIDELLENERLGVIFKPKTSTTLRERLGEVNELLQNAEETGRCLVMENISRTTSITSPIIAAIASDLCIHGHLCAGSAALEAYLTGTPTLLIDREGFPQSKYYELPEGKVRFKDWPQTIIAMNKFFHSDSDNDLGNWKDFINDLDPFRDGLGAKRMGDFLEKLRDELSKRDCKDEAIQIAAEAYKSDWGEDKIIFGSLK
tara:strand:+ start:1144 stop:3120 length:1977 start_codon:yes stop_codon:yes gene_type:complete